jgi:transcriptional regulator with XRE-family HTH domain
MTIENSSVGVRVGYRIKHHRKQKKLTQEKLAWEIGITSSYMGQLERGGRGITVEMLVRIARALNVPPADLLKGIY